MGGRITRQVTLEDITLQHYNPLLHRKGTVSHAGGCGQGGTDTCHDQPMFSITTPVWTIASCVTHLPGALEQARTMNTYGDKHPA